MMKYIVLSLLATCVIFAHEANAQHNMTAEDIRQAQEAMKQADQMMNDPQYQKYMQEMQKQMQANGVNPAQMPSMNSKNIQASMGMSNCMMSGLGADGMNRMQKQGEAMSKEIEALCKAGQDEKARSVAMAYAKKVTSSKDYKVVQSCAEKFRNQYDDTEYKKLMAQYGVDEGTKEKKDICDGYGTSS